MERKVCVITGATSGIGRAAAIGLASPEWHVVLLSRNERAAGSVIRAIQRQGASGQFFHVDLTNFDDVRNAAAAICHEHQAINVLVNNAGARFSTYQADAGGVERTFATNHLGHFLLTALLLGRLASASAARVITIGSSAQSSSLDAGWLLTADTFERRTAYAISKLANVMFAYELARRLRGTAVTSNALDPGGVATHLGRNNGVVAWLRHLTFYALKRELRTSRDAGADVVPLARDGEYKGLTGMYFHRGKAVRSTPLSYDLQMASTLWTMSVQLTKLDASIGEAWRYVAPQASTPPSGR